MLKYFIQAKMIESQSKYGKHYGWVFFISGCAIFLLYALVIVATNDLILVGLFASLSIIYVFFGDDNFAKLDGILHLLGLTKTKNYKLNTFITKVIFDFNAYIVAIILLWKFIVSTNDNFIMIFLILMAIYLSEFLLELAKNTKYNLLTLAYVLVCDVLYIFLLISGFGLMIVSLILLGLIILKVFLISQIKFYNQEKREFPINVNNQYLCFFTKPLIKAFFNLIVVLIILYFVNQYASSASLLPLMFLVLFTSLFGKQTLDKGYNNILFSLYRILKDTKYHRLVEWGYVLMFVVVIFIALIVLPGINVNVIKLIFLSLNTYALLPIIKITFMNTSKIIKYQAISAITYSETMFYFCILEKQEFNLVLIGILWCFITLICSYIVEEYFMEKINFNIFLKFLYEEPVKEKKTK